MPQQEVCEFLIKNKGIKFSVRELSDQLNIPPNTLNCCLTKLIKFKLIKCSFGREKVPATNGITHFAYEKEIMRVYA